MEFAGLVARGYRSVNVKIRYLFVYNPALWAVPCLDGASMDAMKTRTVSIAAGLH